MRKTIVIFCMLLAACATDTGRSNSAKTGGERLEPRLLYPYDSSEMCRGCHSEIYDQYRNSMHAKSFSNPLFNAQYFNEVVPRALRDRKFVSEARSCVLCHAPVVYMNYTGLVATPQQVEKYESGVSCDFCHTLSGYAENGDYVQNPSGKKQGPLTSVSDLTKQNVSQHFEYSGFLPMAEYCGRCHNATNHVGVEVKSTFYEWRESSYGKRGLVCQECHMNKIGYLKAGVAEYDSGAAAYLTIGTGSQAQKEHQKLHSHAFPGAHSNSQIEDALQIEFRVGTRSVNQLGMFPFTVLVNNERSGHKMPTGSSDLRFMWLEVTAAAADGAKIPILSSVVKNRGEVNYSIAGSSPDDAAILGDDLPAGSRLYRTVLVNAAGRQSLFQYDAVKNVFDNRLGAAEIRKEVYYLTLPDGFSGKVTLEARLYYRGAPSSFTKRMQVPDFSQVLVASQKKQISIEATHAPNK